MADLRANRSAVILLLPDVAARLGVLGVRQRWLCL